MPTNKKLIRLAHSPDPDDAFMFYALACGALDTGRFQFEHILRDIQTLNNSAQQGKFEVTAISVHAYPYVQDKYAILNSGASMGATALASYIPGDQSDTPAFPVDNANNPTSVHGPLLIAAQPMTPLQAAQKTIAVPGTMTSAFLAANLALGPIDYLVMMFDEIPEAVAADRVDAGLIIHEGQLTYEKFNLHCVLDLGHWWYEQTKLPLPLGCNVIRRDLGRQTMDQISAILKASINYALSHRQEALKYALQYGRELDISLADEFVAMYVNQWTLDYGPVGRKAVTEFLSRGYDAGIVPKVKNLEFI